MSNNSILAKSNPKNELATFQTAAVDPRNPNKAGLQVGNTYPLKIVDLGRKGDGVGYIDGMVIFVKGASMGDDLRVKIIQIRHNCAIAIKDDGETGE